VRDLLDGATSPAAFFVQSSRFDLATITIHDAQLSKNDRFRAAGAQTERRGGVGEALPGGETSPAVFCSTHNL
jgi:hypothetical protein